MHLPPFSCSGAVWWVESEKYSVPVVELDVVMSISETLGITNPVVVTVLRAERSA